MKLFETILTMPASPIVLIIKLIWLINNWYNTELDILLEHPDDLEKEFLKVKNIILPKTLEIIISLLGWIYIINDIIKNN